MDKNCSKCKIKKSFESFSKDSQSKDGFARLCKKCSSSSCKKYRKENKNKVKNYNSEYKRANKNSIKIRKIKYRRENESKIKAYGEKYRKGRERDIKLYNVEYGKSNRQKINKYCRDKRKSNLNFKLRALLRARISHAIKGRSKSAPTMELLGCSMEEFKTYFSAKFTEGMTWEIFMSSGRIHIDHILPCSSFNLVDFAQQRDCFHYSNLQPLWALDNLRKGDKVLPATNPDQSHKLRKNLPNNSNPS